MSWDRLPDEEKEKIIAEWREKWPRFKNDHPRQKWKGQSTTNRWREYELDDFIMHIDRGLFISWREFQREYNLARFKERLNNSRKFLERYRKTHPMAADLILSLLEKGAKYGGNYKETNTHIHWILNNFRPEGWSFRRGEEE